MLKVDEMIEKRTTWTMRGWMETLKDGSKVSSQLLNALYLDR